MTPRSLDPPFGAFALTGARERLRRVAAHMPRNRLGRMAVSLLRRACTGGRPGPFDVEVFPGVRARLHPASNRCEKRALAGPQFFDLGEREALRAALARRGDGPFVFLDLGANVGLYSLWVLAAARAVGRDVTILAVEPDSETRARLETNLAASQAPDTVHVAGVAIGARAGRGAIVGHAHNRGEHRVRSARDDDAETVEILPVDALCARFAITRIDAMKVDLEGHDEAALAGLFAAAPTSLWPELIIVEAGKGAETPSVVRLCLDNGYQLDRRTRLNALLTRASRAS